MATKRVNLDTTQYALVDVGDKSLTLQSHRDTVRIVVSNVKPARSNTVFHELGGSLKESILHLPYVDYSVWALSMTDRSALTVTTHPSVPGINTDRGGREGQISQSGDVITAFRADDVSVNFQYGISTFDIVDGGNTTGTGAVGTTGSMAYVEVGTGIGFAELPSRDNIRYRSGHECYCFPSVVFSGAEEGVNQYAGFLNGVDGFCLGYEGLVFGLWFVTGGVFKHTPQSEWLFDKMDGSGPSGIDINPQTGNIPGLKFTWHGFKDLTLEFDLGNGRQVLAHEIKSINVSTEPHLGQPNLPVAITIERTSGAGANLRISSSSWRAGIVSGIEEKSTSDRWFPFWNINVAVVNTNWYHIATLRSKDTFQSKINHIKTLVKLLSSSNATNKDVVFAATRMSALDAADQLAIEAGFNDINSLNSVMEGSKVVFTLATTITDSILGDVALIPRNDKVRNEDVQGLDIYPGEDIVFIASVQANGDISFQTNLKELH